MTPICLLLGRLSACARRSAFGPRSAMPLRQLGVTSERGLLQHKTRVLLLSTYFILYTLYAAFCSTIREYSRPSGGAASARR